MKALITKVLVVALGLTAAAAPLAASAQEWHGDRGRVFVRPEHREFYRHDVYRRDVYRDHVFFHEGRWFAHRRWAGGIWLYF